MRIHGIEVLLIILLISTLPCNAVSPLERLGTCMKSCSKDYAVCMKKANGLWGEFHGNRKKILDIASKCCIHRSRSASAKATDSFSACVKVKCGASLFGFVVDSCLQTFFARLQ